MKAHFEISGVIHSTSMDEIKKIDFVVKSKRTIFKLVKETCFEGKILDYTNLEFPLLQDNKALHRIQT